jgi:hypothetical protein
VKHARFLQVEALEAAPAASEDGTCAPFRAIPRMFNPTGRLISAGGELTVLNKGEAISEGDLVDVIQDISGFWTTIAGSGGSTGQYVVFQFEDEETSSSSGSGSSSGPIEDEGVPEDCASRVIATGPFYGRVTSKACGMTTVPGENEAGLIELEDDLGILDYRDYRDIAGRLGYAVRMQREEPQSVSSGSDGECYWMIVIVNFWRTVKVVSDFIFDGQDITIRYKNLTVWDDCQLPDEVLEGFDCEASSSSGSV